MGEVWCRKTTHTNAPREKIAQYPLGAEQTQRTEQNLLQKRITSTVKPTLSKHYYKDLISCLVSFHSVSLWACRLFAAETPCLPITLTLGPRHVKALPISCRKLLLHRTLTDSILFSLNPFDMTKEVKRSGRKEAEGKTKMKGTGR